MHLYGKNPVLERLRTNPQSIKRIYIEQGLPETSYIHRQANKVGIPVIIVPRTKIQKLGRNVNTQGVLVDTDDFQYMPYDEALTRAQEKNSSLLFLDNLNDPQNLGAILRSVACLGDFIVVLPTHDSVSVTETVLRVASGAENYIPVCRVGNLGNAIIKAKENGFQILGAVVKGGQALERAPLIFPLGLVIGSEQKGIRDIIRRHVEVEVSIPMATGTMSFNVAHASSILCYEISKQKKIQRKA